MLASSLPDPGTFEFPAAAMFLSTFLATAYAFLSDAPRDEVQWLGLLGGFAGAGIGILVWVFGLITGLY